MGDIECLTDFIGAVADAILGEHFLDLQPRCSKDVPDGVLVFFTVHPAPCRASLRPRSDVIVGGQRCCNSGDKLCSLFRSNFQRAFGWHFAISCPVVDADPSGVVVRVSEVLFQGC